MSLFSGRAKVSATVWALGFVSLFMDISSEMIHALLPLFLTTTLGASVAFVGLVEGVGEATVSIAKVLSGWLSDRIGNRKWPAAAGYAISLLTKPVFAFAGTPNAVLAARFADRIGSGVRGAPRDALIADVTPKEILGRAYGLRYALDTVGAVLGPLIAIALMMVYADNIRSVFAWAIVPAAASTLIAVFAVKEPPRPEAAHDTTPIRLADMRAVGAAYWMVVVVGAVFTMARFSQAFLILRARDAGLTLAYAPVVMVIMNVVLAAAATPAGAWSDRWDRRRILTLSLVPLIVADLVLAFWPSIAGVALGAVLWGVHFAMSQGLFAALVADTVPARQRGTAFGVFNFISGVVLFFASFAAGAIWQGFGPAATFLTGGGFAFLSLAGLLLVLLRPSAR